MIYVIEGKPYIKVANYYKEVKITKHNNEYNVIPVGGEETRIEINMAKTVIPMSLKDYLEMGKNKKQLIENDIID